MNNSTFQSRLLLNCGNLATTHPFGALAQSYVNDGMRMLIALASAKFPNYQLFPELKDIEWTDLTIQDQAYLALPSDQYAIMRAYSLDSSSAATVSDLSSAQWRILSYIDPMAYDQYNKASATVAYPSLWTQREGVILLFPTPRATKTTYVKIDGIEDEPNLVNTTDTPRTNARWHPAMLDYASYLMATDMGWTEDAQRFMNAAEEKVQAIGATMKGMQKGNTRKRMDLSRVMPSGRL